LVLSLIFNPLEKSCHLIAENTRVEIGFYDVPLVQISAMRVDVLNNFLDELNAWKDIKKTAFLWWRDDDASLPSAELNHLIRLSDQYSVPCGLAAIPLLAGEPLKKIVSNAAHIWVLQHGYSHKNHAPSGNGAWELGLHRPKSTVLEELHEGMNKFSQLFKSRFVPVVVPPWNKMDSELFSDLPVMGFRGVSASYKKNRPVPPSDLRIADAHCDVLSWKNRKVRFAGVDSCVSDLVEHLKNKRIGIIDPDEPTCVLTHHLEMDDAAWDFMDTLFSMTTAHPAADWISPAEIWPTAVTK
jgi:hypothetical protein